MNMVTKYLVYEIIEKYEKSHIYQHEKAKNSSFFSKLNIN